MEAICSTAMGNSSAAHSSQLVMSFNGKRPVPDEMDFFAEKKSFDNQMVHQMELDVDVGKLIKKYEYFLIRT